MTLREPRTVRRLVAASSLLTLLAVSLAAFAQSEPTHESSTAAENTVEEVLVTGEQPGPGLWKVSSGEHTLWILGMYTPLPKKFKWRSKDVEALIGESQEVLTSGSVDADANIGIFKALTLLPAMLAARKNHEGKTVREVLASEVFA